MDVETFAGDVTANPYGIDLSAYPKKGEATPQRNNDPKVMRDWGVDLTAYERRQPAPEPALPEFTNPDAEKYFPPLAFQVPDDNEAPGEVQRLASAFDRTLAISRIPDASRQINLFARANDIGNMYLLGKQFYSEDNDEIRRLAEETQLPENLVKMLQRHEPDKLEARRLAATILAVAGPDSYIAKRFSTDPKYAMDWRDDLNELNNLEAAIRGTHGSLARITWDWFAGATANTVNDIAVGIPAWGTQVARDLRDNYAPNFAPGLVGLDDWMQDAYKTTSAVLYRPPPETGDFWLDSGLRPLAQGAGSYLPSFGLGLAFKGAHAAKAAHAAKGLGVAKKAGFLRSATLTPAAIFGMSEGGSVYRTNRAEGVDTLTNLTTSLVVAAIHTWAEKISLDQAFKSPGIASMWEGMRGTSNSMLARAGRVGHGMLTTGTSEAITEGIETITSLLATPIAKSISLGDPISNIYNTLIENGGTILESMWGGFGSGGFIGGGLGGTSHEIKGMWLYGKFQRGGQAVMSAADALRANGRTTEQIRPEIRNMVHHAIEQKTTDLPATAFADAGDIKRKADKMPKAEAERFLQSIEVDPVVLEQAVENGVDVEVRIENTLVGDNKNQAEIFQLFRPDPSMDTAAHIKKQIDEMEEIFNLAKQLHETIESDIQKNLVPPEIGDFYKDLRAIKMSAKEAAANTSLIWAFVKTTALKRGISVEDFIKERPLRAAMDSFIRNNPQWVEGIRRRAVDPSQAEADPAWSGEDAMPNTPPDSDGVPPADTATPPPAADTTAAPAGDQATKTTTPAAGEGAPAGEGTTGEATAPKPAQRSLFDAPPIPPTPGQHQDALTGLPLTMETTTTEGVGVDPGAFQFKRQADNKTGVKKNQELVGDVDPAALGIMVFYEDIDGQRWVVSGHHRLELLRRKGRDEEVRAVILKEKDGWTTAQARVYGAALNIKEGGGDVDDYATFFRESGIDLERAEAEGLLRRENARLGYAIGAQGGDNTFYGFLNGELSARKAAAIAEAAPGDHALQDTLIDRNIKLAEIPIFAEYARKLKNTGALNMGGVQLQLFTGKEHSAMLAAMQKESKTASLEVESLEKKAAALEKAVQAGKTLTPAEMRRYGFRAGNKIDMIEQAAQLREEAHRWKNFFQHPDILAKVQERAGTTKTVERYHQTADTGAADGERIHDVTGKEAPVVVINSAPWRGKKKEFRKRGKELLDQLRNLVEPLVNTDTGWEILFNREGISKTLTHKHSPAEWQALEALPHLVENAVLWKEKGDRKGRGEVEGFAYLYAPVVVGGRLYSAEITVKNGQDGGHRFYLHRLKLKDPTGPENPIGVTAEAVRPPAAGSMYSISELLGIVNEAGPERFEQTAYHGSPHRFDRFSLDAMSTGEGSQAFGWGLYFASNKEIAEFYRNAYTGLTINGQPSGDYLSQFTTEWNVSQGVHDRLRRIASGETTIENEIQSIDDKIERRKNSSKDVQFLEKVRNVLEHVKGVEVGKESGQVYKVNIPESSEFLHWHKPLHEQPEAIQNALEKAGITDKKSVGATIEGNNIYHALIEKTGSPKTASKFLNDIGIKGVIYPDSSANDGHYNYVLFDDNAINILETYYQNANQGDTRGYMDWHTATPTHRAAAIIGLTKKANSTTVPHELAHYFLADMRDYVATGKADMDTLRQWQRLVEWAGDLSKVENVEKVTRGFEQYLYEGKAPSLELVNSFDLFSRWFSRAWASVREYVGLDMSNKVRGVFDSWLATDQQIAEAEMYYAGRNGNMFNNLIDDEEERRRLSEKRERNRKRVKAKYAGDMVGSWMEAHGNEEQIRSEALSEIRAMPAYQAIARARRKKMSLDGARGIVAEQVIADIQASHGDLFTDKRATPDVDGILQRVGYFGADSLKTFLTELADAIAVDEAVQKQGSHGRKKRYYEAAERMGRAGGLDMETAVKTAGEDTISAIIERHGESMFYNRADTLETFAAENGFSNAEEMLVALSKAPNIAELVENTVQQRIQEKMAEGREWATDQIDRVGEAGLHNHKEDIEAETIDETRRAIWKAMQSEQRRRQEYIDRKIITDRAREDISKLPLREACNYAKWAEAERRHAAVAAREAESGDREVVLAALDKQQYFHALVTEAYRIREERQKFTRKYAFRMANSDLSTVEYKYREVIKDILSHYNIIRSRDFKPDNADPKRLTLPAESDNYLGAEDMDVFTKPLEESIPEWLMNKQKQEGYLGLNDLTADQMRDMDAVITLIMGKGRGELHALRSEKLRTIAEYKKAILENLEKLPDFKKGGDQRTEKGRGRRFAESYIVNNLMIERILAEADGHPMLQGKEMGILQDLGRKIRNAEITQMELLEKFHIATQADFELLDGFTRRMKKERGGKFFSVDGVDLFQKLQEKLDTHTWDSDLVLSVFMNLGNAGTRHALVEGYGISEKEIAALARLATTEEWRAIERIGQRLGDLFPLLDEVHFRHTNQHMVKVDPVAFAVTTADGETIGLTGWYYPAHYDPALSDRAAQIGEMQDYKAGMNAVHTPKKAPDGFTRARKVDENGKPVVTYPPLLSLSVLTGHLQKATRWATHAEILYEFRQLTMDPDFKKAFIDKLGAEKYRYLRQWTNRMANPEAGDSDPTNKVIARLRNLSTVASLGWNASSALRQNESLGIAADIMTNAGTGRGLQSSGWFWILQGFKQMGMGGFLGGWVSHENGAIKEMHGLSAEAKMRAKNVNKDIRDLMGGIDPSKRRLRVGRFNLSRDIFFHFTKAMDQGVAGVVWWGAYLQGMNGAAGFNTKGLNSAEIKAKAVIYADHVLRSQQSPFTADYTHTQANKGAASLFTQFMGGVTPYLSHTYGMNQLYQRGQKSNAAMVRHLVNTYALPVLVKIALRGIILRHLLGRDEEEESFASKLTWGMLDGLSSPLPVVRDIVSVARYGERSASVPAVSTPARAMADTMRAGKKLTQGEVAGASRDLGRALRMFVPLYTPLKQAGDAAEALGIMEGDE